MAAERERIIRASYEAFNSRNVDELRNWLHPDFHVELASSMGFDRGRYVGEDGLRRFFESYWDAFDSITIEVEELIDGDEATVAIIRARGRGAGSGAEVDARGPHLWTFQGDRVVSLELHEHLDRALEAAGIPATARPETP